MEALDTGATAWMLTSASLVLLMTPALAFFYGGMSRTKSVLNMMMMSIGTMAVIGVIYPLWGYSMSYGESSVGGIFANPFDGFNLSGLIYGDGGEFLLDDLGVPAIVGVAFQATFAIITVALISGAIADRSKFSSWLVFAGLWATLAYFPMAHMVWGGGFLSDSENGLAAMLFGTTDGAATVAPIDFAGGTVV
ncbi:ammonium transporter, partial [Ancrocorticia populi]